MEAYLINTDNILNDFRPKTLEDVIGHKTIIKSIKSYLKTGMPHVFLFHSTFPGAGKTTFGRLIANLLNSEVIEIDAATDGGVDFIRELNESVKFKSFTEDNKVYIIDECHNLSIQAWQSFLKTIEEPPKYVYFIFCTTSYNKVPSTIREQRAISYHLKEVDSEEIEDLLLKLHEELKSSLPKKALTLIAEEAYGSPRKALNLFSKCFSCTDMKEVIELLEIPYENESVSNLIKLIANPSSSNRKKVSSILKDLKSINPESIRIQIVNYFQACVLNSNSEKDLIKFLNILEIFSESLNNTTGFANLVLKVYQIILER